MDFLMRRVTGILVLVFSVLLLAQPALASREYQLKAAFIFNFIKFVEWPESSGPIKVGVLGEDPFKGELDKLEKKKVGGRAIQVSQLKSLAQAKDFQLVFTADADQAKKLVTAVAGKPVLTVSDTPGFSKDGGGITLTSARNRIRFSINTKSLKSAGLKASSKLLGLAAKLYSRSALSAPEQDRTS
jgi:hypothetical protein